VDAVLADHVPLLRNTSIFILLINIIHGRGRRSARRWPPRRARMVSFTGSVETGSAVMAAAAPNITKVNLELGGKAPAIVMSDADINLALDVASKIKAGSVWVNSTNLFDAASGFGGYRESGFGREGGREGLFEYLRPAWQERPRRA
jgi:acyl-CoA reductase-like NAD-dependent aldehyde dehydrogenase